MEETGLESSKESQAVGYPENAQSMSWNEQSMSECLVENPLMRNHVKDFSYILSWSR